MRRFSAEASAVKGKDTATTITAAVESGGVGEAGSTIAESQVQEVEGITSTALTASSRRDRKKQEMAEIREILEDEGMDEESAKQVCLSGLSVCLYTCIVVLINGVLTICI